MFHIAFLAKFVFFLRLISHFLSQFLHLPISFVCIVTLIMIRDRSCHRQTLQTKSLISEANYFCDKSSATKFQLHIRAELS